MSPPRSDRETELRTALVRLEERIGAACRAAGRARADVTLIAVTKTHPATDVRLLAGLGVTDVAENKEQEGGPKSTDCADLELRWHFVGQVQRNKAGAIARWAAAVHSVDRDRLVPALAAGAEQAGLVLDCFVQVALDAGALSRGGRGGARPAEVPALADLVAAAPALRLRGLMAVGPREGDPRRAFGLLWDLGVDLRRDHPGADALSAGMSGDLEAAVAAGATHLRIGSALLGMRPALR